MKKFIIGLVAILLILGIALPWGTGYIFKRNYVNLIESWNRLKQTQIEIIGYEQGWFKSSAQLMVKFLPNNENPVIIKQKIYHGPFVYSKAFGLRLAPALVVSEVFNDVFSNILGNPPTQPFLSVVTLSTFSNTYTSQFKSIQVVKDFPNGFMLNWEGFTGSSEIRMQQRNINHVSSEFKSEALLVSDRNKLNRFQMLDYSSENEAAPSVLPDLWNISHISRFAVINTRVIGRDWLLIKGLNFMSKTQFDGRFSNSLQFNLSLDDLTINNRVINPASFNLKLENLDGEVLTNIMHAPQSAEVAANLYPTLINEATSLKIDLSINTPQGLFTITSESHYPKEALPKNVQDLKNNLMSQTDIRISKNLLITLGNDIKNQSLSPIPLPPTSQTNTVVDQINQLIAQGYLIEDKSDYISSITVDKGVISINGKPFPPVMPGPQLPPAAPAEGSVGGTPIVPPPPEPAAPAMPQTVTPPTGSETIAPSLPETTPPAEGQMSAPPSPPVTTSPSEGQMSAPPSPPATVPSTGEMSTPPSSSQPSQAVPPTGTEVNAPSTPPVVPAEGGGMSNPTSPQRTY